MTLEVQNKTFRQWKNVSKHKKLKPSKRNHQMYRSNAMEVT